MSIDASALTLVQQVVAHKYWHTLLFPSSPQQLHAARRGLKDEEGVVIDAVVSALVMVWNRDQSPRPEENPFVAADVCPLVVLG